MLKLNKTWEYLAPSLSVLGLDFVLNLMSVYKLGFFLKDENLDTINMKGDRKIFILIRHDSYEDQDNYKKLIEFLSKKDYYITNYNPSSDIYNNYLRMVVIEYPLEFASIYESFLNSAYSKMYDSEQLETFFGNKHLERIKKVLTLDSETRKSYIDSVNKMYNTNIPYEDFPEGMEIDFPWEPKKEYFNIKNF